MRTPQLITGEFYHLFNHGIEGKNIVSDQFDSDRFVDGLIAFKRIKLTGSIEDLRREKRLYAHDNPSDCLVKIISYCVNPNHYHLLVEQLVDDGIARFMHRHGTGFTNFFNTRHKRAGVLFQGKYKVVHITGNEQLLHTSAYVNLNDHVHGIHTNLKQLVRSSWQEYMSGEIGICEKGVIVDQFKNMKKYKEYSMKALDLSWAAKIEQKERRLLGM